MTKHKQTIITTVIFAIIILAGVWLIFSKKSAAGNEIIFYYGDGCPHCAKVEDFVKTNGVDKKIKFTSKEVYNNRTNSDELVARYAQCGLPTDNVGVPLLWDGGEKKCYSGDQDIINYFSGRI